eukprot:m.223847 g.223847  ORF g.223847 m.223847 type:complete len:310 (+) comp17274_c0_seq5:179-1108(+)
MINIIYSIIHVMAVSGSITFQNGSVFNSIIQLLAGSIVDDTRLTLDTQGPPNHGSIAIAARNPKTRSILCCVFNQGIWLPSISPTGIYHHYAIDPTALLPTATSLGDIIQTPSPVTYSVVKDPLLPGDNYRAVTTEEVFTGMDVTSRFPDSSTPTGSNFVFDPNDFPVQFQVDCNQWESLVDGLLGDQVTVRADTVTGNVVFLSTFSNAGTQGTTLPGALQPPYAQQPPQLLSAAAMQETLQVYSVWQSHPSPASSTIVHCGIKENFGMFVEFTLADSSQVVYVLEARSEINASVVMSAKTLGGYRVGL